MKSISERALNFIGEPLKFLGHFTGLVWSKNGSMIAARVLYAERDISIRFAFDVDAAIVLVTLFFHLPILHRGNA